MKEIELLDHITDAAEAYYRCGALTIDRVDEPHYYVNKVSQLEEENFLIQRKLKQGQNASELLDIIYKLDLLPRTYIERSIDLLELCNDELGATTEEQVRIEELERLNGWLMTKDEEKELKDGK